MNNIEKFLNKAMDDGTVAKEIIQVMYEALKYYSVNKNYSKYGPGERREFGCGCCAGTMDDAGFNDHDDSVVGRTSRQALEKCDQLAKEVLEEE